MRRKESVSIANRSFWGATVLVALLGLCFLITFHLIQGQAVEDCYRAMEQATDQAADSLLHNVEMYRRNLGIIADLMPEDLESDPEGLKRQLDKICATRVIAALCVRTQSGMLIAGGSDVPDFSALPPFEQERDREAYVSGIFPGRAGTQEQFLYQTRPIRSGEQVTGILYSFLNLKDLPGFFPESPYGDQAQLYLVDTDTGDFLMDTWHDELLNLYDGSLEPRESKRGYDQQTMIREISEGKSGYYVFISHATEGYFYTRYQSAGINNWSMQMTVPEDVAFADTQRLNRIMVVLAVAVLLIAGVYLFFVLYQQRVRVMAGRMRMRQTNYMYEVQQLLFDAHESGHYITAALKLVAETVGAEGVMLTSLRGTDIQNIYPYFERGGDYWQELLDHDLEKDMPDLYRALREQGSILIFDTGSLEGYLPELLRSARGEQVKSLMLTSVLDDEGELKGLLCAVNLRQKWDDCRFLECVARSFLMALHNMESYQIIRDMGSMDTVTGLKNRNAYESALARYASLTCGALHCVFVDLNGLHETNDQYGHKVGDAMLRTVAERICAVFGWEHTYRVGGDEFVTFIPGGQTDRLAQQVKTLCTLVEDEGYYISVGIASQPGDYINIDRLITRAEEEMYRAKRKFYEEGGSAGRGRTRGGELERLLQEKRDSDDFLELITSYYMGVYVVDLHTDLVRVLRSTESFSRIVEQNGRLFRRAMQQYAEEQVQNEDRRAVLHFLDYEQIQQVLRSGRFARLTYQRNDGISILVRVIPGKNFSLQSPETFWLFQQIPDKTD